MNLQSLQKPGASGLLPAPVLDVLTQPGSPLAPTIRSDMESRFGSDFSSVRIHSNSLANQAANSIASHAFTFGNQIVSASPNLETGILAHELSHTIQQRGNNFGHPDGICSPRHASEREASSYSNGDTVSRFTRFRQPLIQRMPKGERVSNVQPLSDAIQIKSLDDALTRNFRFVFRESGAQLFTKPDDNSNVVLKLQPGQKLKVLSTDNVLPPGWTYCVARKGRSDAVIGFVKTSVLNKNPVPAPLRDDPAVKMILTKDGDSLWKIVRREYGIRGDEGSKDLNINHFANAIRKVNQGSAFYSKPSDRNSLKEMAGDVAFAATNSVLGKGTFAGRDIADTGVKAGFLWIPSYSVAARMDVGSGTVTGEIERYRKKFQQKVRDFEAAIALSLPLLRVSISQVASQLGAELLAGLVKFAGEAAVILAGSTAIGALIGAIAGGVGAVPGAKAGFEVGLVILKYYGIFEALRGVLGTLGTFFESLGFAIASVWRANGDPEKINKAAIEFSKAFAILISVLVAALASIATKKAFDVIKNTRFGQAVGTSKLTAWFEARKNRAAIKDAKAGRQRFVEARRRPRQVNPDGDAIVKGEFVSEPSSAANETSARAAVPDTGEGAQNQFVSTERKRTNRARIKAQNASKKTKRSRRRQERIEADRARRTAKTEGGDGQKIEKKKIPVDHQELSRKYFGNRKNQYGWKNTRKDQIAHAYSRHHPLGGENPKPHFQEREVGKGKTEVDKIATKNLPEKWTEEDMAKAAFEIANRQGAELAKYKQGTHTITGRYEGEKYTVVVDKSTLDIRSIWKTE